MKPMVAETTPELKIGNIYYRRRYGGYALVVDIHGGHDTGGQIYRIGAGGPQEVTDTREVVLLYGIDPNAGIEEIAAQAADYHTSAAAIAHELAVEPPTTTWPADKVEAALGAYEAAQRAKDNAREAEEGRQARQILQGRMMIRPPAWAKAIIVAYPETDDCDTMTDYYAAKRGPVRLLAWSRHTRDLFPELRQAARNCPETYHLADAPKEAEHREKWSMGGGYYLKDGGRWDTGWMVHKIYIGKDGRLDDEQYRAVADGRCHIPGVQTTSLPELPSREKLIDMIVAASIQPCPEIRASIEVEVVGGTWHRPWGIPAGKYPTGAQRIAGYAFVDERHGYTHAARPYATEQEARDAWQQHQERKAAEFRAHLLEMSEAKLYAQAAYWIKEPLQAPPELEMVQAAEKGKEGGGETLQGVDVRKNEALNGIEIRFAEKPEAGVLARLKAAGFRWHRRGHFWYAKQNQVRNQLAASLANLGNA